MIRRFCNVFLIQHQAWGNIVESSIQVLTSKWHEAHFITLRRRVYLVYLAAKISSRSSDVLEWWFNVGEQQDDVVQEQQAKTGCQSITTPTDLTWNIRQLSLFSLLQFTMSCETIDATQQRKSKNCGYWLSWQTIWNTRLASSRSRACRETSDVEPVGYSTATTRKLGFRPLVVSSHPQLHTSERTSGRHMESSIAENREKRRWWWCVDTRLVIYSYRFAHRTKLTLNRLVGIYRTAFQGFRTSARDQRETELHQRWGALEQCSDHSGHV